MQNVCIIIRCRNAEHYFSKHVFVQFILSQLKDKLFPVLIFFMTHLIKACRI